MINPDLEIQRLRKTFQQHRKVVVGGFLLQEIARRWRDHYLSLPPERWTTSFWPRRHAELPNHPDHQAYHTEMQRRCKLVADNGVYARFHRRIDGKMYTDEIVKEVIAFFESQEMQDFVAQITGIPVTYASKALMYIYEPGDFVAEHRDKGDGRVTYVYHLSEDWKVQWGGLFVDLTDPQLKEYIVPIFNHLVMFDMSSQRLPHEVTAVEDDAEEKRLSITGWLK